MSPFDSMWLRARAMAARVVAVLVVSTLLASAAGTPAAADNGVRWFEGDPTELGGDLHGQPMELGVGFLMDCDPGSNPPACGAPPARWEPGNRPITMCSHQGGRPTWLSDAQFRQALADAAATWNSIGAAISVRYIGDCTRGTRWVTENGLNEIGFDDTRDAVRGSAAGVTRAITDWSPQVNPTARKILEADIVIDNLFANQPACFATTVAHEMGHVIGLSHSDVVGDLMYPTFNPASPLGCPLGPSNAEQARVRELYGVNRPPTVTVNAPPTVRAGIPVSATAVAVDPEDEAVTYEWTQISGPTVSLAATGATVTFTAPLAQGVVQLRVVATDASLHPGSGILAVTITVGTPGTGRISGTLPQSGFGLFVFSGGTEAQLLVATGCPAATAAFWASDGAGSFVTFVPGTAITAVNEPWLNQFASGLPDNTPLLGRCSP